MGLNRVLRMLEISIEVEWTELIRALGCLNWRAYRFDMQS